MPFFPADPSKYRPAKILFKIDVLQEADRAVQEGLGGYANRHELVNDLLEQGLIGLRYPEGDSPAPLPVEGEETAASVAVEPIAPPLAATPITAPASPGAAFENELAEPEPWPLFGMHNRDTPTAWALNRLAEEAAERPIRLAAFYQQVTDEAWGLAQRVEAMEEEGGPKLAVMLPRNREKPQTAADGFRAFALGAVARRPDEAGKLVASGPFFQWGAAALLGDARDPEIGLTEAGWELIQVFDGIDFSLPHAEEMASAFLGYLRAHAPADFWGFRTALEAAAGGAGRAETNEFFHRRLSADYPNVDWKTSVADSVASGYVSRAREWGLVAPKLQERKYVLTPAGERTVDRAATASS
jgi:hypothetical protein